MKTKTALCHFSLPETNIVITWKWRVQGWKTILSFWNGDTWQMRTVSFREGMVWWNSTMSQLMMNPSFFSKAFRIRKSHMAFLGDDFKWTKKACSPLFGDMIQFDQYGSDGLKCWKHQLLFENGFRTQFVSKTFLGMKILSLLIVLLGCANDLE